MAYGLLAVASLVIVFGGLAPTLIAVFRDAKRTGSIFAINVIFAWTIIGWIIALVWAVKAETHKPHWIARI